MTSMRTCEEGVNALCLGRQAAEVQQVLHQHRQRMLNAPEGEAHLHDRRIQKQRQERVENGAATEQSQDRTTIASICSQQAARTP